MSAPRSQVSRMTENEWTVMVFFAGDPRLSPSMTAQLKALKDAGFQDQTTVLVHSDFPFLTYRRNRIERYSAPKGQQKYRVLHFLT